jgi:hypothetical protein
MDASVLPVSINSYQQHLFFWGPNSLNCDTHVMCGDSSQRGGVFWERSTTSRSTAGTCGDGVACGCGDRAALHAVAFFLAKNMGEEDAFKAALTTQSRALTDCILDTYKDNDPGWGQAWSAGQAHTQGMLCGRLLGQEPCMGIGGHLHVSKPHTQGVWATPECSP